MAKDGTQRGGARIGAGKKRKPLEEKNLEGKTESDEKSSEKSAKIDIKPPKKYLVAEQKDGGKTYARQIYRETWEWIASHGCENFIPKQIIENYAQVTARHIQCEEKLSDYGMIGRHPTTGGPMLSPYEKGSIDYLKQASQLWNLIYTAVRDNSTNVTDNEQNDLMEGLLRRVK